MWDMFSSALKWLLIEYWEETHTTQTWQIFQEFCLGIPLKKVYMKGNHPFLGEGYETDLHYQ